MSVNSNETFPTGGIGMAAIVSRFPCRPARVDADRIVAPPRSRLPQALNANAARLAALEPLLGLSFPRGSLRRGPSACGASRGTPSPSRSPERPGRLVPAPSYRHPGGASPRARRGADRHARGRCSPDACPAPAGGRLRPRGEAPLRQPPEVGPRRAGDDADLVRPGRRRYDGPRRAPAGTWSRAGDRHRGRIPAGPVRGVGGALRAVLPPPAGRVPPRAAGAATRLRLSIDTRANGPIRMI